MVIIAVVAVLLVVNLGGGDDEPIASSSSATSSSSASSTSSSPSSSSSESTETSEPTSTGGSAEDLVSVLPSDFTDCEEASLAGDGDTAAAQCGAALTQPGPAQARFYQYPDTTTMDDVFLTDVTGGGLSELPTGQDCSTTVGYYPWATDDRSQTGQVGCAILTDGTVLLVWTDDQFLIEGYVTSPGTTQADVSALYEWWRVNSNYVG